jgi:DNA-directed RNA polymerase
MATPAEIDEQVQLERDQIAQGLKRLHKNTQDLENKSYASASVYGIASIDILLPLVVRRIEKTTHDRLTRGTGHQFQLVKEYVSQLEPLASAAIALKLTFDKVFSFKEGSDQLTNVCDAIGHAVEDECQMRFYERSAPGLLNVLKKKYWHSSSGTHQRLANIRRPMNAVDVKWDAWGRANRVKLGAWLLDCIIAESHWFTKEMRQEGRKRVNYVVPTPEFMSIKDKVMKDAELFAPLAWPMLIEPNDWTNDRAGGYLLNELMRGHDMVRRGQVGCIQGETPIEFLNKIQKVAFTLNPFVVEVAEELDRLERAVGKFLPIVNHDLPPKPVDIAENKESRKKYRQAAAQTMNLNAQAFKKSCRTRMTMEAVKRFKDVPKFYIPWSFDYRGRAYPIPAFLTPQDTDFGKSLLVFAEGSYMTPEAEGWLAFQVATTYGLDKAPLVERLEWTRNNHELFTHNKQPH